MIGGGLVGLATALHLSQSAARPKLLLLEKENTLAKHQSGHNSGVIHSGIYYPPGSLKAANCLRGYKLLTRFCDQYEIPFEICGKIIVATKAQEIAPLHNIFQRGQQHGLPHLKRLQREELKAYEPHVSGLEGVLVPQTGIVDYKAIAEKYAQLITERGGEIRLNQKVTNVIKAHKKCTIVTQNGGITAKQVINCCGLYSDTVARMTEKKLPLRIIPFRGEYYTLRESKKHLVNNLIYPVPDPGFPFLGVHFTRTITGHVEAGPNAVLALKREGYKKSDIKLSELMGTLAWPGFRKILLKYWKTGVGEMYRSHSKRAFTKALQRLVPEIQQEDLLKAESGVRAQACSRAGKLIDDFIIIESEHAIHVCNAPSPAATASLAIGETVGKLAERKL